MVRIEWDPTNTVEDKAAENLLGRYIVVKQTLSIGVDGSKMEAIIERKTRFHHNVEVPDEKT